MFLRYFALVIKEASVASQDVESIFRERTLTLRTRDPVISRVLKSAISVVMCKVYLL